MGRLALAASVAAGLGGTGPAHAGGTCKVAKANTLPVTMAGTLPLVKAAINGTTVYFILDTGAWATLLFPGKVKELGLPSVDMLAIKTSRLIGVDGETAMRGVNIATFTLGNQTATDWHIAVSGVPDQDEEPPPKEGTTKDRDQERLNVVGLLGEDVLSQYDVEFDLNHGAVTLYRTEGCAKTYLAQWTKDAMLAEIDSAPGSQHITSLLEINGQRIHAIVDSGASHSLLSLKAAARAGVTPDSPGVTPAGTIVGVAGQGLQEWLAAFDTVTIGDETVRNAKLRIGRMYAKPEKLDTGTRLSSHPETTVDMLLGADFLKAHHVLIARGQNLMYFSHEGGPIFQTTGDVLRQGAMD